MNVPGLIVSIVHDLPLDSNILIWREDNVEHTRRSTETYKLLVVENKTCKIQLLSGLTNLKIITIKPYPQEDSDTIILVLHDLDDSKSDLVQSAKKNINDDNGYNIDAAELPHRNPACTYYLPTRFQYMANISVFIKNDAFQPPFTESQHKDINGLLKKVLLNLF